MVIGFLMDYVLDKRGEVKKDFSGVSVFRYELAERKSTSRVTGIMKLVSSTVSDHTMEGIAYGVYDLQLENSQLSWKEQQMLYRDMPADNDNHRPVAFDAKARFYLENGKLGLNTFLHIMISSLISLQERYLKTSILLL
ncbi:MAG: hypothetical protein QUS12_00845 [Methanosarcina sp.]|nr:hypothetical protein [Methanosarcina sp.]